MEENFDLSELLIEAPAPEGGAAAARKVATQRRQRRQRRQAVGGALGALLIASAGTIGILKAGSNDKPEVQTRQAGVTIATTEAPTTIPETTTSTTLDPRQRYVGLRHSTSGSGMPLGTDLRSFSWDLEGANKVGDIVTSWTKDDKGEMVWLEKVVKVTDHSDEFEVLAVFDVPATTDNSYVDLSTVYANGKTDPDLIAIFTLDGKPLNAWRIDRKKLTMTAISVKGLKPAWMVDTTPPPADPPRPELYNTVVKATTEDRQWYTANEGVTVAGGGGGGGQTDDFIWDIRDTKANVAVALWQDSNKNMLDIVTTPAIDGAGWNFGTRNSDHGWNYKGADDGYVIAYVKEQNTAITNVYAAWKMDLTTHKFVSVPLSDINILP